MSTKPLDPATSHTACALTVAGSDSGGGAGVQADLKTFAAHRVHGLTAVAALTAQSTTEVRSVHAVPASFVAEQIDVLADDFIIDVVKTGMIGDPDTIDVLVDRVRRHRWPLVVDPVMVASSGARLADRPVVHALVRLFAEAHIVTPNLDEVEVLLGFRPENPDDMVRAGQAILDRGARAALIKGGHLDGDPVDILVTADAVTRRSAPRLSGTTHGSGCTYASALAARLARGESLADAFEGAHLFVHRAIEQAPAGLGRGPGPLHHLHPHFGAWASAAVGPGNRASG